MLCSVNYFNWMQIHCEHSVSAVFPFENYAQNTINLATFVPTLKKIAQHTNTQCHPASFFRDLGLVQTAAAGAKEGSAAIPFQ